MSKHGPGCETCPFNTGGEGLVRRNRMRPRDWQRFLKVLEKGESVYCDEAKYEDEREICEGAEEWKLGIGLPPQEELGKVNDLLAEMRRQAIE